MQKVIPGSSRAALNFMVQQWRALATLSILPATILLFLNFLEQEYTLLNVSEMARMKTELGQTLPKGIGMILLLTAIGFIPSTWLFVRITNFWSNGQVAIGFASPRELPKLMSTLGYGVLMLGLSFAAYFFVAVVFLSVSGVDGTAPPVYFGPLMPFIIIPIALLIWIFYRFAVALPGIALDERPSLFQDVWPLAKGESFAVPMRIAGGLMVITGVYWFYGSFTTSPILDEFIARFRNDPNLAITPEILSEWNMRVTPYSILGTLMSIPFVWFTSLLLCEAYSRFRKRGPYTI